MTMSPYNGEPGKGIGDLFVAQFHALRDEMVKHIELRDQSLSISLIAFGSLAAAMAQTQHPPFLLLYPILVLFLTYIWSYHERAIRQIGRYIREQIEPRVGFPPTSPAPTEEAGKVNEISTGIWWENYLQASQGNVLTLSGQLAASMVFVGTGLIALIGGLYLSGGVYLSNALNQVPSAISEIGHGQIPQIPLSFLVIVLDVVVMIAVLTLISRTTRPDNKRQSKSRPDTNRT